MIRLLASPFGIKLATAILACVFVTMLHGADDQESKATDKVGWLASSKQPFRLLCRINASGGFRELYIFHGNDPVFYARDVTAYLWQNGKVIYSASPMYGKSGIFIVDPTLEIESSTVEGTKNEYIVLQSYTPASHRVRYTKRRLDMANDNAVVETHEIELKDDVKK